MKIPRTFVEEDVSEKLFDEMLENNSKRSSKLEGIEDLVLIDIPEKLMVESYNELMRPRYVTEFDGIDAELDCIHIGPKVLEEIDFIKRMHVTNLDVGFYKLDLLIMESEHKDDWRYYHEQLFDYEQGMNKGHKYPQVKHLLKEEFAVIFYVSESQLNIESPIIKKMYDYYRNKFGMKSVNVRKVIELV